MWAASDIADWWEEQHRSAKKELDSFVDNNPNLFGVIVATAVATTMDVGSGTVDMLRFGEGTAEGGVSGVAKDALRLVGLMGPIGKAAKFAQIGVNARLARLIVDPGGGICGWVSGTSALRQVGAKAFVAVEDLAKALGKPMSDLGGSRLGERIALFRQLGARISPIKSVSRFDEIAQMTRNDGSVTMFNVFGKRAGQPVGHAVYAFRDLRGQLQIMDRGGSAGKLPVVFSTLDALALRYGLDASWTLKEAAVLDNVFAKVMAHMSSAPVFALATYATTAALPEHNETIAQAFEVHKLVLRGETRALEQHSSRYHTVSQGDSLSKLAKIFYGNEFKWPLIYEANRCLIGGNPNLIRPGQKFMIPIIPSVKGMRSK